ncbi:MAG: Flp family type IVb pilin [Alphaproteobacteria bacterium]
MIEALRRFMAEKTGAMFVEYALITTLVGVGGYAAMTAISDGNFDIHSFLP